MGWLRKVGNFCTFGALDRREAKSITQDANHRQDEIREELESAKEKTQKGLTDLGNLKAEIYSTTIQDFVVTYNKVADVDLSSLKTDNNALSFEKNEFELVELQSVSTSLKEATLVSGGLAVSGAVAAYGAMGLISVAGTTAAGTAIGTLSGVAASNATLAWLGGGALSAGGSGVAGGMVVLGGIALAPVAVLGMFLGTNKGKQQLNEANDFSCEVDVLVEKIRTLMMELSQVRRGCHLVSGTIKGLNGVLMIQTSKLKEVTTRLDNRSAISKHIIDPIKSKVFKISLLSYEEIEIVNDTRNAALLLKKLLDMPLMDEEGAFMSNVLDFIENKQPELENMLNKQGSNESYVEPIDQMLEAS